MNGRIIATNEGSGYLMDGNTRRPIADGHDFACYEGRGHAVIRGMSDAEANGLGITTGMPMCFDAAHPKVSLRSSANGLTVTAEFGYGAPDYGMLRARSGGVSGAWEIFRLIGDCYRGWCALQSEATRQYVTAERDYQGFAWGELRARSSGSGAWEQFRFVDCNASGCGILAQANSRYVANEMEYTGQGQYMLRARSETIGGWERFHIDYR